MKMRGNARFEFRADSFVIPLDDLRHLMQASDKGGVMMRHIQLYKLPDGPKLGAQFSEQGWNSRAGFR